ncbi:hypothetical protein N7528_007698 [Penicillium herquei]|nr:hypothetical protein N7528_007698 [Penicillium herquei]
MSLLQKGFATQVSAFATRSRPQSFTFGVRSPLRQVRQPRRYNSQASKSETPKEGHNIAQPNASATAAGAASTPNTTAVVSRSRAFREIVKASPLGTFGRWYARVQSESPYKTQIWSSIIIYLFGDLGAQLLFPSEDQAPKAGQNKAASAELKKEDEKPAFGSSYNPWRTVRHLMIGAISSIPSYKWFMFLHNNFNYSSKFLSILTKVVVQQMCFTPVFNTYFFSMHSLLAGASFEETFERLKKALPVSITNSVKLWPAVTAFSFMYVPPEFRNVFSGGIAVCWQTYLSWLNQKAAREVREAEAKLESAASHAISGNLLPAAGTA